MDHSRWTPHQGDELENTSRWTMCQLPGCLAWHTVGGKSTPCMVHQAVGGLVTMKFLHRDLSRRKIS